VDLHWHLYTAASIFAACSQSTTSWVGMGGDGRMSVESFHNMAWNFLANREETCSVNSIP
jgi:hypothetical protein